MHELALADAVVTTALQEAAKHGISRITSITVRIGELQRIERDTFAFALREIVPKTEPRIAAADILLEIDPAVLRCRPCGRGFGLADVPPPADEAEAEAIHFLPELAHSFVRCPSCGSPDFEVESGRGVSLDSIEGD